MKQLKVLSILCLVVLLSGCIAPSLQFKESGPKKFSGAFYIRSEGVKHSGTFVSKYEVQVGTIDSIVSSKSYFYSSFGPRLLTLSEKKDSVELDLRGEKPYTIPTYIYLNLGKEFPELPLSYGVFLRLMKGKLPIEVVQALHSNDTTSFTVPVKNSKYSWNVLISKRKDRIESITLTIKDDYSIVFKRPGEGFFYEVEFNSTNNDYIKIRYDS